MNLKSGAEKEHLSEPGGPFHMVSRHVQNLNDPKWSAQEGPKAVYG